ncbi:hypothetical protein RRU01S_07_00430 [Agrobacterium rubi TR3 = NBRC 13261]|uniref:Uncharacterized protein n=1 Tax=Agrobacterium rubi TR3 = NBRC 13261 TaxID=1368415 RepID=A0A081CS72_9HYPH|nr:hypothetical protein [Agrobacterium rubi]MBP1878969.1 hypothetical protein [Agrobacterium rubi]GAK69518.1 hypothetical protein RRU01S_07_00430 [Agrobacterium rubi TR3 = NBRC 13261]
MNLIAHPLSTTAFPLPDSERETRRTRRDVYETNTILLDTPKTATAEVLVCLTLFNEPVEAMNLTLAGLVRNQLTLRSARAENTPELKICIMLDGCRSIDPDTSRLLQTFGLNPDRGPGSAMIRHQ